LEYTETGRSGSALTDDIDVIVRSLRESETFREAHVYLADELENREYAGYKRGLEQGISQGIDQGIEQGIERGIAQGIEKGISQGIEQGIAQGIDMGISQGEHKKALDTARRMLSEKCGADLIQRVTGLSLDEINSQLRKMPESTVTC
jgi:flagellar biosynthesis/type III secretory pathway protein FliH